MYTLSTTDLQVEILDPVADKARFGVRYCTGGYIFQVTDTRHGPLLTGPTYPESFNWFDGQGIPDAFNLGPLRAPDTAEKLVLVIGVGLCDLGERRVQSFCSWQVEASPSVVTMRTSQSHEGFGLDLERTVSVSGRTVRSETRLANTGNRPIPICWFPHPFFPQPDTPELFRTNVPVSMPENEGYAVSENGYVARKNFPTQAGYYQALDHAAQSNLVILQRHPALGLVAATCSYVPSFFPIWGNRHTFSWEPFFERTVAVGQDVSWDIAYDF